jgi:hypothetical protein
MSKTPRSDDEEDVTTGAGMEHAVGVTAKKVRSNLDRHPTRVAIRKASDCISGRAK